jgi:hypothetical protein
MVAAGTGGIAVLALFAWWESGMDLGLLAGAVVAMGGCAIAMVFLPGSGHPGGPRPAAWSGPCPARIAKAASHHAYSPPSWLTGRRAMRTG